MDFQFAIFLTCIVNAVWVSGQTYVCENSQGDLHCPAGQVINITNASYGRENATICSTNATTNANATNCPSQNVTGIMRDACNGAQDCIIQYSDINSEDPCPNVTKYLTVDYKCENFTVKTCGRHQHFSSVVCDCINQCLTPDYACNDFCSVNGGCVCNTGYRKDPISGKCVGEEFCAQGQLNQTHEVFSDCANRQRTCIRHHRWQQRRCVPGYACAPGYIRDVFDGQCVKPDECPRPFPRG